MRLSLREIGEIVESPIAPSVEDREGFDRFLDLPLRLLAAEFRNKAALRAFVMRKLEHAEDQRRVRRIAAIFDAT